MESIDNLRIELQACDEANARPTRTFMRRIADEIEAEISERYMPLPLDADGVTIHIGDMLENKFSDYGCLAVHGYTETCALCHKVPPADLETYYVEFTNAHHVKPRTIEDVLEDFLADYDRWDDYSTGPTRMDKRAELFKRYAKMIREVG